MIERGASIDAWDPAIYGRFSEERDAPFFDLVAGITTAPRFILDLGCGDRRLTAHLYRQLGAKETLGIDASARMLERAPHGTPGLTFVHAGIDDHSLRQPDGSAFDWIASNAALQWIDDHPRLFSRLRAALPPGGELGVQMPANHGDATHVLAREMAGDPAFAEALQGSFVP